MNQVRQFNEHTMWTRIQADEDQRLSTGVNKLPGLGVTGDGGWEQERPTRMRSSPAEVRCVIC